MARKGRQDRGLLSKKDSTGKLVWYVRLYHEARERRFGSFKTKTEARDFYEKAKQEQKRGRFFPERYQHGGYELVQEMLDGYMAHNTNTTKRDDVRYARWWGKYFQGKRLNHIAPPQLEQAMRKLTTQGLLPQTVLHYLKFLRHVLNIAVRDGRLERNPVSKIDLPKVHGGKLRYLSLEEEVRLCEMIGSTYTPWVRLAILTGMRRKEQFSLKWSDVNLEQGIIALSMTKAGGAQYVSLNEEAKGILESMDSWQRSIWVFPSENPRTHVDPWNFYRRRYLPAVKDVGLEGVTWHTLRHTFASRLAMSGASDYDIAACLRHSTTSLVRRYAHLSPSHLKGCVEKVAAFGKPIIPTETSDETIAISSATVTETGKPVCTESAIK